MAYNKLSEDMRIFSAKHANQGAFKYLYYPDIRVALLVRLASWLFRMRLRPLAYLTVMLNDFLNGVWIGPRVEIGKGISFGHPRGTVINPGTKIGDYCTLLHGVTCGGPGVTIGNFVELGAGAKIISTRDRHVVIGDHSIVGAGAVVTRSVPPYSVVVGVPGRVVKQKNLSDWLALHPYYRASVEHSVDRSEC